jgi:hypothetical protein
VTIADLSDTLVSARSWLGRNSSLAARILLLGCSLYLLVVMYPFAGDAQPIPAGDTWPYGLNYLVGSPYLAGRDWAFTYGPLGFLLFSENIGKNLYWGLGFWIQAYAIFSAAVVYLVWHTKRIEQGLLFVAGYTLATALGLPHEPELFLLVALLLVVALSSLRLAIPAAVAAGILSSTLVFVKLTLGLEAILMIAVASALYLLEQRQEIRDPRPVLLMAASIVLTSLFLVATFLRSLRGFIAWLVASIELVRGYSIAMSTPGSTVMLLEGVAVVAIVAVAAFLFWRTGDPARALAPAFAIATFCVFKEGYVRQDPPHIVEFFPVALCLCALLVLASRRAAGLSVAAACLALVLAFSALAAVQLFGRASVADHTDYVVTGQAGWQNVEYLADLRAVQRRFDAEGAEGLATLKLPAEWLQPISKAHGTVDVVPLTISYVAANDLRWDPNPALQFYAAYTTFLDQRTARHFLGHGAPDFLLLQYIDIDGRNPWLSAPATWRAILDSYQVIRPGTDYGIALLQHRVTPAGDPSLSPYGTLRARTGEDVIVPQVAAPLYAKVTMRLSPRGEVEALLLRIDPVNLELRYASGMVRSYRVTPETMRDGVLINYLPVSLPGFVSLLTGSADDRVTSFRIAGPGAAAYSREVDISWWTSSARVTYLLDSTSRP